MDGYTVDLNPTSVAASVTSLLSTLAVTISILSDLPQHNEEPPIESLCLQCEDLYRVLTDLELIIVTYAKHWASLNDPHLQIPLDAMLYTWISDCTLTVLGLQEKAIRLLEGEDQEGDSVHATSEATQCIDESEELKFDHFSQELKVHTMDMQSFMPIMKTDLDDFLKTNIAQTNFPLKVANNEILFTNDQYQGDLERLRAALYGLSDEIKAAQAQLNKCSDSFPDEAKDELVLFQQDQSTSIKALAEMLTNNGSEWIESMLAGKMTFQEFSGLDRFRIREYSSIYAKFNLDLRVSAAAHTLDWNRFQMMRATVGELNKMLKAGTGTR